MFQAQDQTPVQTGVEILRGFFNYEFDVKASGDQDIVDTYQEAAQSFARTELRVLGYRQDAIEALFRNHENYENMPIYDDYYRLLTVFNRKVLTATSSVL